MTAVQTKVFRPFLSVQGSLCCIKELKSNVYCVKTLRAHFPTLNVQMYQ